MEIFYLFIFLVFLGFFSFVSLAPFVPTKDTDLERIHKFSRLSPGEIFLEIGCGTAKVSAFIARKYPENQVIGIEFSPFFYLLSQGKAFFSGQKNLQILYGNALHLDFHKYDVFYIFGTPDSLKEKIIPKFQKEAKQNARLLSYCFCLENSGLKEVKHKEKSNVLSIYEYQK